MTELLLTTEQAAQILNRPIRTITEWAESGRLKGTKRGRGWRFQLADVEELKRELAASSAASDP